jgi:hypothetical protein
MVKQLADNPFTTIEDIMEVKNKLDEHIMTL